MEVAGKGVKLRCCTSTFGQSCIAVFAIASWLSLYSSAQLSAGRRQVTGQNQASADVFVSTDAQAEEELQKGTALTRRGSFMEAIPHLLSARGRVSNEYAAGFNLALCYVGTGQSKQAIEVLNGFVNQGHDNTDVQNLLAQAYIGNSQSQAAFAALQKAATLTPQNEKLFSFVADACMSHQEYALGLKVVNLGLRNLPQSARLHYERGIFLAQLDEFDQAKPEFELARKLAPGSEIAYLSSAYEELFAGNISETIRVAREGVKRGYENYTLLTILGEALIRSGIVLGQAEFAEAQTALERSVALQPNDPNSQISLGKLYLIANRLDDAVADLERARQIDPNKPSVYANLAKAYQRRGDVQKAQDALAVLARLNQAQAERISSAPGDRKAGYAGQGMLEQETAAQHP